MATLDPLLDHTFIDLQNEIKSIKDGQIPIESFSLMKFLDRQEQQNLIAKPENIDFIDVMIGQYANKHDLTFEHETEYFSPPILLADYNELVKLHRFLERSISSKSLYATEYCALHKGSNHLERTTMFFIIKRFHQQFGLDNFLFCYVNNNSYFSIFRQMVQSRLNFMMHGKYLPIIVVFLNKRHATSLLLLPTHVQGFNGNITWHFIHINSNGNNEPWKERFSDIPRGAFSAYVEFSAFFQHQSSYKESNCVENIQTSYGTCGSWSILLAIFIFASIESFSSNDDDDDDTEHTDLISKFCKNIANVATNPKTLHRFHQCMIDLEFSFQHLTLELYSKAAARSGQFISEEKAPMITFQQYKYELVHGSPGDEIIQLDVKILQTMREIQHRFNRYLQSSSEDVILSDDETDDEKKYKRIFTKQGERFKQYEEKCDYLQWGLVEMKNGLEKMYKSRRTNKCESTRIERRFVLNFKEHLMWMSEFERRGQDIDEWIMNWFEDQMIEEIVECEEEIQRLSFELGELPKTPKNQKNQKKIEKVIEKMVQQKEDLTIDLYSKHLYRTKTREFMTFAKGVQTKVKNAEHSLVAIQQELDELRQVILAPGVVDITEMHALFQQKFSKLLNLIDGDFKCGKDPTEWLEYWFKNQIFEEMKQCFDDIYRLKIAGTKIPVDLTQKWEMFRTKFKDDTIKTMARDFLTFATQTKEPPHASAAAAFEITGMATDEGGGGGGGTKQSRKRRRG